MAANPEIINNVPSATAAAKQDETSNSVATLTDERSNASRMSLEDRTFSYNRVHISDNLKNQICSQIADSSESLPLWREGQDADDINGNSHVNVQDTSEVATPLVEKGNPLENKSLSRVPTAKDDGSDSHDDKSRPGTLRRLTTAMRRKISSTQSANR